MKSIKIHNTKLVVVRGSLLDQGNEISAIVNAANTKLQRGGGICGEVYKKAGEELSESLLKLAPNGCNTGDVVITPGFETGFDYIFHTPGPVWINGNHGEPELLESCYWRCLDEANMMKIPSIGFCSISTGVYGYPLELASKIALQTVEKYICDASEEFGIMNINLVKFCMFLENEYNVFANEIDKFNYVKVL